MADITEVSSVMQLPSVERRQPVHKKQPVNPPVEQEDKYEPAVREESKVVEVSPDEFSLTDSENPEVIEVDPDDIIVLDKEDKKKPGDDFSAARAIVATAAGIFTGKKVYEFGKKVMDKGIQYAEKEIGAFEKEFGKDVINISRQCKAVVKYCVPALAGLTVAGLIIKDADNDGQSDLAEAINKFINPGPGM